MTSPWTETEVEAPASEENLDAIAIIGMSGRFPQAPDLATFWRNLQEGRECIRFFSEAELEASGVEAPTRQAPGFVPARATLEQAEAFDAAFFGISPREAELTDPQHRLFLECAWEALEHGGYDPARFPGLIGVYAGADINTYALHNLMFSQAGLAGLIGNDKDYLATRVSFKLNLHGPSLSVQTACSTSLVAVQLACQSLLSYQCDLALAGGVGVAFPQKTGYWYQEGGILSPDGHCRAFDARAKGTVGGDGVGVVLLKRLGEALEAGDTIHAIIKGSAINNDGAQKVGFTAPSVQGQAEVIALAQAAAAVDPDSLQYIEAHGTGTELGDPIEITALSEIFRERTQRTGFCAIGSLKSNVGHMNSAAGIGALLKTVLALQARQIPPSLHYEKPNPRIDFENSPFYVNAHLKDWPRGELPRRAGVSSFGIGGTNAHVILEEAPPAPVASASRPWQALILSAKTASALEALTEKLAQAFQANPGLSLADVAYTLQVGRALWSHRRLIVCQASEDLPQVLRAPQAGRMLSLNREPHTPSVAFLFPGQGTQYVQMSASLYQQEALFRATLEECALQLQPHLGCDLRDLLFPLPGAEEEASQKLQQTSFTQPALFVVEYALARLWMAWGVEPQAMLGHSIGEYVAACLAGVMSLEEALRLVALRGKLIQQCAPGAMLAVPLPEEEARRYTQVSLAALNAPAMSVLSGTFEAIEEVEASLKAQGVACRRLHTSHAFHSAMLDPMLEEFRRAFAQVKLQAPQIPYLSNVTGTWITPEEATDPQYWVQHVRQPVRFAAGIGELLAEPNRLLLEVGPGRSLGTLAAKHSAWKPSHEALASLPHAQERMPEAAFFLTTLGQLYCRDVPLDWRAYYQAESRRRVPLPTYPFERELYSLDWKKFRAGQLSTLAELPLKKANPHEWLYAPSWKRQPWRLEPFGAGTRLVFGDDSPRTAQVLQRLREAGGEWVLVQAGSEFRRWSSQHFSLAPQSAEDYQALAQALGEVPLAGVVHLWNWLPQPPTASQEERFRQSQAHGLYSLLFLAQALGERGATQAMTWDLLTSHTLEVTGEETLAPERSTLLGIARVIPQEYPGVTCRVIDLPAPEAPLMSDLDLLLQVLQNPTTETTLAVRGQHLWQQTFEALPAALAAPAPVRLRPQGTYLITGGLGEIGLIFAEYFAQACQARLILLGRSGLPPKSDWEGWLASHDVRDKISRRIAKVQALEKAGAEVLIFGADVGDKAQMEEVLYQSQQRFGKIDGVIHAAGILDQDLFRALSDTREEHVQLQFRPKIQGTAILEKLLPADLDFGILCSSLSTILGGVGFGAYAAANHFLDVWAGLPERKGRWVSVAWDGWQSAQASGLEALSVTAIAPAEGVKVLERLLSAPHPAQVIVSTSDLHTRRQHWAQAKAKPAKPTNSEGAKARHTRPESDTPYVAPRDELEATLAQIWQDLLGFDQVGVHDNFFRLGGDSLLAIQLSTRLRETLHLNLTVHHLFDEPTIAGLAAKIRGLQQEAVPSAEDLAQKLEMIENLSDEEVQKLLAQLKG